MLSGVTDGFDSHWKISFLLWTRPCRSVEACDYLKGCTDWGAYPWQVQPCQRGLEQESRRKQNSSFLNCKIRLGRGPATLSHKNQLATETTSVTNAIQNWTSVTCHIPDES